MNKDVAAKELAKRAAQYLKYEEEGGPDMAPAYSAPYYRGRYDEVESLAISMGFSYGWWAEQVGSHIDFGRVLDRQASQRA